MNSEHPLPYRCAVYFVPEVHSDWWQAGSQWLGRCAASGASFAQPEIPGLDPAQWQALTADPRRYGWHATLKAPFTLASGQSLAALRSAMQELASQWPAFDLPSLQVSDQGGFLALRPVSGLAALNATAAACVQELHPLAQPLSDAELARRRLRVPAFPGRLFLHAARLELPDGRVFEAPLPPELEACLAALRGAP